MYLGNVSGRHGVSTLTRTDAHSESCRTIWSRRRQSPDHFRPSESQACDGVSTCWAVAPSKLKYHEKRGPMSTARALSSTPLELIQRAQNGDLEAFSSLYDATRRRVFSLCLRMVHNYETAEDLTQETFVLAFTRLKTFRGDSAFTTWLHRIAVNVILMFFRKNRSIPDLFSLEAPVDDSGEEFAPREWGAQDGTLTTSLDRIALERAISLLPNGYRLMLILHDIEGYQHEEIAVMLGCSMGNTKSQLHKARLKMRELLQNPPVEESNVVSMGERKRKRRRAPKSTSAINPHTWAPAA